MPGNDDVNDAAWILIHLADDLRTIAHDGVTISDEHRRILYDRAALYVAVHDRYQPDDSGWTDEQRRRHDVLHRWAAHFQRTGATSVAAATWAHNLDRFHAEHPGCDRAAGDWRP